MTDGQRNPSTRSIAKDPDYGSIQAPGLQFHMTDMGGRTQRRPPRLGEHTGEVLAEIGYDAGKIESSVKRGAVAG